MPPSSTVDRILDTAEALFAEKGFAETSLRAITSKAGVNLAAVNYHFGSKEALIQAVFQRFLEAFCVRLDEKLRDMADDEVSLEALLSLVSHTSVAAQQGDARRVAIFFRLSGLGYTQGQGHLRKFLRERYGDVFTRFLMRLQQAVPDVSPMELFWRVHFALGSTIFTLSGMDSLRAICKADFGDDLGPGDVDKRLIAFLAGGIRASVQAS
ncbi:MAG: TetR family transcriptional regulator [Alcanivoracaceae bacterium]|nr:TetR family transcriptional regulator [Alcanivoracaceae bacterium]